MTTVKALLEQHDFFDQAIIRHGFTDYMRDYELIVQFAGQDAGFWKYQFVGCVEAVCVSALPAQSLAQSMADEYVLADLRPSAGELPAGFIWAVRCADVYPGWTYVEDGERVAHWSKLLGRKMHEIDIETNVFNLRLVFADVRIALMGHEPELKLQEDHPLPIETPTSDGGIS